MNTMKQMQAAHQAALEEARTMLVQERISHAQAIDALRNEHGRNTSEGK